MTYAAGVVLPAAIAQNPGVGEVSLGGFRFDATRLYAPGGAELGDSAAAAGLREAIDRAGPAEHFPSHGWVTLVEEDDLVAFGRWYEDFDEWTVAVVRRDGDRWCCSQALSGVRVEGG